MPKKKPEKSLGESLLARKVCGTCDCWERYPDEVQEAGEDIAGECVLYPPKVLDVDEDGLVLQASPIKTFRERCGQYRPKVN